MATNGKRKKIKVWGMFLISSITAGAWMGTGFPAMSALTCPGAGVGKVYANEKAETGKSSEKTEETKETKKSVDENLAGRRRDRQTDEAPGNYAFLQGSLIGMQDAEVEPENYILLRSPSENYTVEPRDSLWRIGEAVFANGGRFMEIAEKNELTHPDLIWPGQELEMPDREYYLQKPWCQRGEGYYLSDEGAFRFQTPERWPMATCSLDTHLSTFIGDDVSVRVLWGIEDNEMGEDAWSENWEEVCQNMDHTAEEVMGENLEDIFFEKYELESGHQVYNMWAFFRTEAGERWTVSASYRFGQKNQVEFIGIGPADHNLDIEKLTLYTAATYEEYEEERHMGYGDGDVLYKGMEVWEYQNLHNPFVLADECVNHKTWHAKQATEDVEADEDYVVSWKEPVLPAMIREALQIEGDIMYSDVLRIDSLEAVEDIRFDYCSINEERFEVDWKDIPDGDALIEDIALCKNLYSLKIQIGDISDYSPIGELKKLGELEIKAGRTVKDLGFLDELKNLKKCELKKSLVQEFVDSLSDKLWERTCEEEGISSFRKEYDGEPGLAFENISK